MAYFKLTYARPVEYIETVEIIIEADTTEEAEDKWIAEDYKRFLVQSRSPIEIGEIQEYKIKKVSEL